MLRDLTSKPWDVPDYLKKDAELMKQVKEMLRDREFIDRDMAASPSFGAGHATFSYWKEREQIKDATGRFYLGVNGDTLTTVGRVSAADESRGFATPDVRASDRKLTSRWGPIIAWVHMALMTSPERATRVLDTIFFADNAVLRRAEAIQKGVSQSEYTLTCYLVLQWQLVYRPYVVLENTDKVYNLRAGMASGAPGHSFNTSLSYVVMGVLYRMMTEEPQRQAAFVQANKERLTALQVADLSAEANIAGMSTFLEVSGMHLKDYTVEKEAGAAERSGHVLIAWTELEKFLGTELTVAAGPLKGMPIKFGLLNAERLGRMTALARSAGGTSPDLRGRAAARIIGVLAEGGWTQPHIRAVAHRELKALGSYNREAAAAFVVSHYIELSREWSADAQSVERVRSFALDLTHMSFLQLHAPGMVSVDLLATIEEMPVVPSTHLLNTKRMSAFDREVKSSGPSRATKRRKDRRGKHGAGSASGAESVRVETDAGSEESRAPIARRRKAENSLHEFF